MATQFEIDCALMAGRAYQVNRSDINQFPIPSGWTEFFHVPNAGFQTTAGFEAVSFLRGSEVVIAYTGTDPTRLQHSLTEHLKTLSSNEDAAFSAIAVSKLRPDGATLDTQAIKQAIAGSDYSTLIGQVLDAMGTAIYGQLNSGAFQIDTGRGVVVWGLEGSDVLYGETGNDTLYGYNPYTGGVNGDDTYVFGWGYGQDMIIDNGSGAGGDTVRMKAGVSPADVTVTRDQGLLYLNLAALRGFETRVATGGTANDGAWREAV